ncbi:regulatory protein RecX [Psychrobacter sp.]|uniref:regulatory protein RecX n=1 Tax=Psychrobacter sp. TaxID=56811 RepID=UPI0035650C7B
MKIKTLAEILAESDTDSASSTRHNQKSTTQNPHSKHPYKHKPKDTSKTAKRAQHPNNPNVTESRLIDDQTRFTADSTEAAHSLSPMRKSKKRKKRFHPAATFTAEPSDVPAYEPPAAQSIKEMLIDVKNAAHVNKTDNATSHDIGVDSCLLDSEQADVSITAHNGEIENQDSQIDNLPAALKAYLRTPEQRQAEVDAIKAESRLRWLAFYYLSRREYGKAELKQKLLDKEQAADKVDALLDEFEEKGYQSDYRTTLMLIRENIRKGRGRGRIKQEFYRKKIAMPDNIDELIDMANAESDEFSEFIEDSTDNLVEGVDWLKLAVSARTRKYGATIPVEQKDKARQLRFLQYRGFNSDICFAALNYTLETLDERF